MFNPTISIIVPVYNAAAYLKQCIGSILQQTMLDIEVIAVNDGSTDNSGVLLDRVAANDQRLKVFHNNNKGVSAARNFGLHQARGTYIGFCDSDDWMEPTMLEELYNAMTFTNSNWAICNVNIIKEGEQPRKRLNMTDGVIDIAANRSGFVHGLMHFQYDNANWNKLYVSSLIQKHQIRFDETMSIWEDLLFNLKYLHYAEKLTILATPLYNYRIHSASLYSGGKKDLIPQFNLLYEGYMKFAIEKRNEEEKLAFKQEMARLTYNQLLYVMEVKAKKDAATSFHVFRNFNHEIRRFNPAVFFYSGAELVGLQGIKRRLLNAKYFYLFSLIIAIKKYFKKPVTFLRKWLNF